MPMTDATGQIPPLSKGGQGGFPSDEGRKRRRFASLAGLLLLGTLAAGCTTTTGGEGITGTIACGSGPVSFTVSFSVVGSVQTVKVTITGPGISSPIEANIDTRTLQAILNVPSGEDRAFKFEVKTDAGTYTQTYTVCVPNNQPSNVGVNIARENRAPVITGMSPASGTGPYISPTTVTVSASDPDGDPLSYEWSATGGGGGGTISGSGSSVTWNPPYVGGGGTTTVSVTVRDGQGGVASASAMYTTF